MVNGQFDYRFPLGFTLATDMLTLSERALAIPLDRQLRDIFILQHLRCHRFFAAGVELCRVGYAIETETFVRNMLEALISLRYMLGDPPYRAELFRNYSLIETCKQAEDYCKAMAGMLAHAKELETDQAETDKIRAEYTQSQRELTRVNKLYAEDRKRRQLYKEQFISTGGKPLDDSWSFVSNYRMAEEANMGITYHLMYKSLSEAVHPTLRSIHKYKTRQNGLMFSPSPLRMRANLMTLTTLQMEMVRTTSTFYEMTDILSELPNVERQLFVIKESDEMKFDDPVVGRT